MQAPCRSRDAGRRPVRVGEDGAVRGAVEGSSVGDQDHELGLGAPSWVYLTVGSTVFEMRMPL